jgi:hypothetical protein
MAGTIRSDQIEQGALTALDSTSRELTVMETLALSQAISLKRIADTMDGTASGLCITETLIGGARNP